MISPRTVTSLRVVSAPSRGVSPAGRFFLRLQDGLFNGLAEWLAGKGYIARAAEHDDLESAYERRGFAILAECRCGKGQEGAVWFRKADEEDHKERFEGWAIAAARYDEGAAFIRGVSTRVEAGRVAVFSTKGKGR